MNTTPTTPLRLSTHKRQLTPPQPLSESQIGTLLRIGDILIPAHGDAPSASDSPDYRKYLELAVAARSDSFQALQAVLDSLDQLTDNDLSHRLCHMAGTPADATEPDWQERPGHPHDVPITEADLFHLVSTITAGAYFMTPSNARRIGYPGQGRNVPSPTEAADDLDDGILDAVIDRGPIYVSGVGE